MIFPFEETTVNTVSNLIQLSVAPVFLIAGVGAILGVLSGRLARITDRIERFNSKINRASSATHNEQSENEINKETFQRYLTQKKYLSIRAKNMNVAILFCVLTGLLVASVIVTLFASLFFEFNSGVLIAVLFITGMLSFMTSLLLFIREIFMATYFMQRTQEKFGADSV